MKKLLFLLLALTVSAPAFAQTQTQYYTVPTIAALKAMTTSRPAVVQVVDSNPGIFNLSAGACAAADDIFQVQPTSGTTVCYTRAATPYSAGKGNATSILTSNGSVPSWSSTLPAVTAGAGLVTATGSTTARSLATRFAETKNVLDYGADNTGVASSTAAFDAAYAALSATGGVIRFPSGTYKFDTAPTAVLKSGTYIQCDGQTNTVLSVNYASGDFLKFGSNAVSTDYVGLSDCTISAGTTRTLGAYINIDGAGRNAFERVRMTGAFVGINIDSYGNQTETRLVDIIQENFASGGTGYILGKNSVAPNVVNGVYLSRTISASVPTGMEFYYADGIFMESTQFYLNTNSIKFLPATAQTVSHVLVDKGVFDSATSSGIVFLNTTGMGTVGDITFQNSAFNTNGTATSDSAIVISATAAVNGLQVKNSYIENNTGYAINLLSGTNAQISSNMICYNSTAGVGAVPGIRVAAGVGTFQILNNMIGACGFLQPVATNRQSYAITVDVGGSDQYFIQNNYCPGNVTGGLLDGGTGTAKNTLNGCMTGTEAPVVLYSAAAFPASFGSTPTNIALINTGSYPTAGMIAEGVLQQYTAAMVIPSTAPIYSPAWPHNNFAAHIDNQGNSGQSGVNFFSIATLTGSNGYVANYNGIVSNASWATNNSGGSGLGNNFGQLVGYEFNVNIFKVGASAPTGSMEAVRIIGGGDDTRPTGGAYGIHLFPLAGSGGPSPTHWNHFLLSDDGAVGTSASNSYFADMGATGVGNSVNSQAIRGRARDGAGVDTGGYIEYRYTGKWFLTNGADTDGPLSSGIQGTTQGSLILANTAGAFPTTVKSSNSASAAWTMTLPTTAGTAGYALTTNGSGVTSWTNMRSLTTATNAPILALANSAGTQSSISYSPSGQTSWYVGATIANLNAFDWYNISAGAIRMSLSDAGTLRAEGNIIAIGAYYSTNGTVSAPVYSNGGFTNSGMWFPAASTLAFSAGGTEFLRSTTTLVTFGVAASFSSTISATIASTSQTNVACYNSGTGLFTYQTWATGCLASSARFKENIAPKSNADALKVVTSLEPVTFNYKKSADMGSDKHNGFIAEQVVKVAPDLVVFEKDGKTPRAVKYQEMAPYFAGAIRELKAANDNLKAEIEQLKKKVK